MLNPLSSDCESVGCVVSTYLQLLLFTGETRRMTLVESLRDAMDITLSKDSTSSKTCVYSLGITLYCVNF